MSYHFALLGWFGLAAGIVTAGSMRRRLGSRMELVARACHEVRGPLQAARLGLQLVGRTGARSAARVAAIDLELRRAALAVDDLAGARSGARAIAARAEAVDVAALLRDALRSRPTALLSWQGPRVPLTLDDATLLAWLMHDVGGVLSVRGAPRPPAPG
jgi:hypothetical protein